MLVILRENIENLGEMGEVVKVSDGYARNFLLPHKLVAPADETNLAAYESYKKALGKKREALRADAEALSKKLSDFSCTISRKVGANDQLFGSVSAHDIAEALRKAGFKVEKRAVQMDDHIKALGVHPVKVKLQPEVFATVKVWVVKEE